MGQYYYVVNIDKKEFLHPHKFGDGLKLLEFGCSRDGTLTALAILLSQGNGRGGGDLNADDDLIGSWAGDRIVIAGDYADGGDFIEGATEEDLQEYAKKCYAEGYQESERVNLHCYAGEKYKDISEEMVAIMKKDTWLRKSLEEAGI
jgi:hypothetical protein